MHYLLLQNQSIKYDINQLALNTYAVTFNKLVEENKLSESQKELIIENISERINNPTFTDYFLFTLGVSIKILLFFFINVVFAFLFVKCLNNYDISFKKTLIIFSLPYYILALGILITSLISLVSGKYISNMTLSGWLQLDITSFKGFILNKLGFFKLWYYFLIVVGVLKGIKVRIKSSKVILVTVIWFILSIMLFLLSRYVPFISGLLQDSV